MELSARFDEGQQYRMAPAPRQGRLSRHLRPFGATRLIPRSVPSRAAKSARTTPTSGASPPASSRTSSVCPLPTRKDTHKTSSPTKPAPAPRPTRQKSPFPKEHSPAHPTCEHHRKCRCAHYEDSKCQKISEKKHMNCLLSNFMPPKFRRIITHCDGSFVKKRRETCQRARLVLNYPVLLTLKDGDLCRVMMPLK